MVQTAITQVIRSLEDIEKTFGSIRSTDRNFFTEWRTELPNLSETELPALDLLRDRFRYQRKMGPVAEGAVNAIVISPLLALAGFYDAPFHLRSEASVSVNVTIETDDESSEQASETLRGRMDFLVLQDRFWQVVIESKETTFDIEMGIPQLLTYMMGAPSMQRSLFGMVSNGNHFMFVKLKRFPSRGSTANNTANIEYGFSNTFSMLSDQNQMQDVLQILKRIGSIVALNSDSG